METSFFMRLSSFQQKITQQWLVQPKVYKLESAFKHQLLEQNPPHSTEHMYAKNFRALESMFIISSIIWQIQLIWTP